MVRVVTLSLRSRKLRNLASVVEVSGSQFALAGTGYLTLALGGRTLDAAGFAAITSFYLLLNVVGRGLCSASELELTRSVAHAGREQVEAGGVCRAGIRHTAVMVGLAAAAVLAAAPLLDRVFGGDLVLAALLALSLPGMAASHVLRGPLAGTRRYHPYAATFAVEATVVLVFGVTLAVLRITDVRWWALGLALGPLVATIVVSTPLRHAARRILRTGGPGDSGTRELVAAVVILTGIQAVWNLPPVLLTARTTDTPAIAAGFTAAALVLRVPALLFPAMQALVLPVLAGRSQGGRLPRVRPGVLGLVVFLAVAWLLGATALTPLAVHLTVGALTVPGTGVLAVLAVGAVVGTGAQLAQTALVAHRRQSAAGAVCATAVIALLIVFYLVPATALAAALVLLIALGVVLAGSALAFWSR
jgi:O-antigen/teichoic acid export membrane protein